MTKLLPLLAAGVMAVPAICHAEPMRASTTMVPVSERGLALDRPDDAARMLRRLRGAALEACGASDFSFREYRAAVQRSDCYTASLSRAVQDLNAPTVTALYEQRSQVASAAN